MFNQIIKKLRILFMKGKPSYIYKNKHGINKLNISENAIRVCETLNKNGFEAYIVGGAIRDLILGLKPKDFDIATNATPEQIKHIFKRARIIGKRFRLVHVIFYKEIIEISTFRSSPIDIKQDEFGRILTDNYFGSQSEDSNRRDFTINSLYYDANSEIIIDYHDGVYDLKKKQVNLIGEASIRYREDPVRILRAIRFASKINGSISPDTLKYIEKQKELIANIPQARLFDELIKILTCGNALKCLLEIKSNNLHTFLIPTLEETLKKTDSMNFLKISLDETDQRILNSKSVSSSFLLAAILWPQVQIEYQKNYKKNKNIYISMTSASDTVIEDQLKVLSIHKKIISDMKTIWLMQTKFETRKNKTSFRLLQNPKFKAAYDFVLLRAKSNDFDKVVAQWWTNWLESDDKEKENMLKTINKTKNKKQEHKCD
ncbi:poly(A) polymerase [Candidatus Kinetoplastibacterium oncopeltii TCC290E]|uniref:Poly(A) polymerase I n=1 Tax=Candidatus Kinetoplastidibacterium stringomonadis TCC290E TaxID=1208920 RepID=M1LZL0_9PROT|nr:polynucleotide adenylyltransferase PcnB [Candidatus Kinetoplastibacterium oncopeltii]AGF48544.1 poly(A) polymerase [Candidatus Kinetoplastibacterium oncopeltii TCC290E]